MGESTRGESLGARPLNYVLLLLYVGRCIGGAQTLMARIANHLVGHGHSVTVVFFRDSVPDAVSVLFDPQVKIKEIPPEISTTLGYPLNLHIGAPQWPHADVAITFNETAHDYALHAFSEGRTLVIPYVIGPNTYYPTRHALPYREHPGRRAFLKHMRPDRVYFMGTEVRDSHAKATGMDFSRSQVLPLPVETARFARIERRPKRFEFVSVGRIDPILKPYNTSCIAVFQQLRREGFDVRWHIYGGDESGERSAWFDKHLADQGAADCVKYHGQIEYSRFPEVLVSAYGFIGMGTAAIEAAAAGVPVIVAIAMESRPLTQGHLHQLPDGSCGEPVAGLPTQAIVDLARQLITMQDADYQALCRREQEHALATFEIEPRMAAFERVTHNLVDSPPAARVSAAGRLINVLGDYLYQRIWSLGNRASGALARFRAG